MCLLSIIREKLVILVSYIFFSIFRKKIFCGNFNLFWCREEYLYRQIWSDGVTASYFGTNWHLFKNLQLNNELWNLLHLYYLVRLQRNNRSVWNDNRSLLCIWCKIFSNRNHKCIYSIYLKNILYYQHHQKLATNPFSYYKLYWKIILCEYRENKLKHSIQSMFYICCCWQLH